MKILTNDQYEYVSIGDLVSTTNMNVQDIQFMWLQIPPPFNRETTRISLKTYAESLYDMAFNPNDLPSVDTMRNIYPANAAESMLMKLEKAKLITWQK